MFLLDNSIYYWQLFSLWFFINFALKNIENLNKKYDFEEECKFFFLNRKRTYNPKENIFMGRERKRTKIVEFINLLKKDKNHTFNLISTSIENLRDARYIIFDIWFNQWNKFFIIFR